MRQVAERSLWLGNAGDLWDARKVLDVGIEAVVELADNEPFADLPRGLMRCRFPVSDGGDNPDWLLKLAADSVAAFLKAGLPVIVCCSAGLSRSVCMSAAGLSLAERRPFNEALRIVVGSGPADVSPSLVSQIQKALGV